MRFSHLASFRTLARISMGAIVFGSTAPLFPEPPSPSAPTQAHPSTSPSDVSLQANRKGRAESQSLGDDNAPARNLVDEYVDRISEFRPAVLALMFGNHSRAAEAPILDAGFHKRRIAACDAFLARIAKVRTDRLDPIVAAELDFVKNDVEDTLFKDRDLKRWTWDPGDFDCMFGTCIETLLDHDYAPIEKRLSDISGWLAKAPEFFGAIRENVATPTRSALEEAIGQCGQNLVVVGSVPKASEGSKLDPAAKAALLARVETARKAIRAHQEWLKSVKERMDRTGGYRDFRLGKANYKREFEMTVQTGMNADALYGKGMEELRSIGSRMVDLAKVVWPRLHGNRPMPQDPHDLVTETLKGMADHHGPASEILPKCQANIDEARHWVEGHGLLTLDPDRQALARDMPASMRDDEPGMNASFVPPAYFYIQVPAGSPEHDEPYLRLMTDAELKSTTLHEAIPGHFVQVGHGTQSRLSKCVNLPGTAEGWAVYAERMIVETGFRADDPEFLLAHWRGMLIVLSNFLVDYRTHALGMGEREAMDLMVQGAFQDEGEAKGRWIRCQTGQVQISSYYAGWAALMDLRERAKRDWGPAFSLRDFNDRVVACGQIPIRDMAAVILPKPPKAEAIAYPEKQQAR